MKARYWNSTIRAISAVVAVLTVTILSTGSPAPSAQRIEITAKRFEFVPNQITLKKDRPVVLVFRSNDVAHGIVEKDLNLKADIPKGRSMEVQLTPQSTGTFVAKCGHFCGSGHGQMHLTIIVTD
jgi:cytochrome c oxidase subunit II